MVDKFQSELAKEKERLFKQHVAEAADALGVPPPNVKVWDGACPDKLRWEAGAHIHLDTYTICVSKGRLKGMNFDELKDTAYHEVAHVGGGAGHDIDFKKTQAHVHQKAWRPKGVVIDGSKKIEKRKPSRCKTEPDKTKCNYHLCRKRRKLTRCKYCRKYFCEEHINPVHSKLTDFRRDKLRLIYDVDGHPCVPFTEKHPDWLPPPKKGKVDTRSRKEPELPRKPSIPSRRYKPPSYPESEREAEYEVKVGHGRKPSTLLIIVLILLVVIAGLAIWYYSTLPSQNLEEAATPTGYAPLPAKQIILPVPEETVVETIVEQEPESRFPITYYLNVSADEADRPIMIRNIRLVREAVSAWENATNNSVSFAEVQSPADAALVFLWVKDPAEFYSYSHLLPQENRVLGLAKGNLLENDKTTIYFAYSTANCQTAITEIHEIGHILGLDHNTDAKSVMNQIQLTVDYGGYMRTSCMRSITEKDASDAMMLWGS